jgi:hypothetical protein
MVHLGTTGKKHWVFRSLSILLMIQLAPRLYRGPGGGEGKEWMAASQGGNPYQWIIFSFSFLISFLLHLLRVTTAPMVTGIIGGKGLSYAEFGSFLT